MADFQRDLALALGNFNQAITQSKVLGAVDKANEHVQAIKAASASEQEKRAQLQSLSQALIQDLSAFGAPGETIKNLANTIAPPERFFQTAEQAFINAPEGSLQRSRGAELIEGERTAKQQTVKQKLQEKQDQRIFRAVEVGQRRLDTLNKKSREAGDSARTMVTLLESNNPVADNAIPTFAARATGEVGNLTEAERKPFGGSSAITRKLARWTKLAAVGKITDADRSELLKLARAFDISANRNIRKNQEKVATQLSRNLKVDVDEIRQRIIPELVLDEEPGSGAQTQAAPGVPNLRQFLRSR